MRLSSLADYAVVLLAATARRGGDARVTATALAEETGLPLPTVQKLVSRLSAAALIETGRGAGGGFRLARHDCAVETNCMIRPHAGTVNAVVRGALAGVTLAQLANTGAMPQEVV